MDKKRLFRALVCFVVVCALVVNISPIKAKATSIAVGLSGAAMEALLWLLAGGVVIDGGVDTLNLVGETFLRGVSVGVDEDLFDEYAYMCDQMWNLEHDWDPKEPMDNLLKKLAEGLLTGIAAIVCGAILSGGLDAEGESYGENRALYGNGVFPVLPDTFPGTYSNAAIFLSGSKFHALLCSEITGFNSGNYYLVFYGPYEYYTLSADGSIWEPSSTGVQTDTTFYPGDFHIGVGTSGIWSNVDVLSFSDNTKYWVHGSEPAYAETITVSPEIYVGDIPDQVKDGEKDENNLELPMLDPLKIFESQETALDNYDRLVEKLKNGEMTYDEMLEQYRYNPGDYGGSDPDVTTPTVPPSEAPDDPEQPEDTSTIQDYKLDLTDFFPFCIPFDIYEFLSILAAEPQAPKFKYEIFVPQLNRTFEIDVDLSTWDSVAQLFRRLELLAFIIGLGYVTREKYLRG